LVNRLFPVRPTIRPSSMPKAAAITSQKPITNRMVSDPMITNAIANPQQIPCRPIHYSEAYGDFFAYHPVEERGEFDGEVSELGAVTRV
jgi:hypothetical protein